MTAHNGSDEADKKPLIVIASNRGPFSFSIDDRGEFKSTRGSGGLVTALAGVAENYEVLWVANALSEADHKWAEAHDDKPVTVDGMRLQLVRTDNARYEQYYNTISNPLLWFMQHQLWDTPRNPNIDRETWEAWDEGYVHINKAMADVIADTVENETGRVLILPQDYHLYMVPHYLRERLGPKLGDRIYIQPFIHIPWPGPDAWRMLPTQMRNSLLSSLLDADRVGFQTKRDAFNFVQTARFYLQDAHSYGSRDSVVYKGRKVFATTYPISIDVQKVEAMTREAETNLLKQQLMGISGGNKMILRVDRIDPSKNILRGFQAFRAMLENYPEHKGKVHFLALLVPSRLGVEDYQNYLREIMAEAGMINAEYSDSLWEPVRIIVGNNYHRAIAAFTMYDVLLVNPIADGMNLVAKEGVLVNERDGVLILSEHAGAFYELGDHAMVVSPFDIYGTAWAMHQALKLDQSERAKKANFLREQVQGAGVRTWFADQIEDALTAFNSAENQSSTPGMPSTKKSAESRTPSGVPSADKTPTAKE